MLSDRAAIIRYSWYRCSPPYGAAAANTAYNTYTAYSGRAASHRKPQVVAKWRWARAGRLAGRHARPDTARGPVRGLLRAGPGRRLPTRTYENFRNNKQIISPSLQHRLLWSAALRLQSEIFRPFYHFSVPTSGQLIRASQGWTIADTLGSGSLLQTAGRASKWPGNCGPGGKFSARAHL